MSKEVTSDKVRLVKKGTPEPSARVITSKPFASPNQLKLENRRGKDGKLVPAARKARWVRSKAGSQRELNPSRIVSKRWHTFKKENREIACTNELWILFRNHCWQIMSDALDNSEEIEVESLQLFL